MLPAVLTGLFSCQARHLRNGYSDLLKQADWISSQEPKQASLLKARCLIWSLGVFVPSQCISHGICSDYLPFKQTWGPSITAMQT